MNEESKRKLIQWLETAPWWSELPYAALEARLKLAESIINQTPSMHMMCELEECKAKLEAMKRPVLELRERYRLSTRPWSEILRDDYILIGDTMGRILAAAQEEQRK